MYRLLFVDDDGNVQDVQKDYVVAVSILFHDGSEPDPDGFLIVPGINRLLVIASGLVMDFWIFYLWYHGMHCMALA